jgi:hypothetical protein
MMTADTRRRYPGIALATAVATISFGLLSAGPALAAGILPPNDPAANIPLDYQAVPACMQQGGDQATCEQQALSVIDQARSQEGVGPMQLPSDYISLAPAQQLLVVLSSERADRGLSVPAGLTAAYNQDTAQAAALGQDPTAPQGISSFGGVEANGLYSVLIADYELMYNDGYSATGAFNRDCTSPSASACWAHRNIILGNYSSTPYFYMGAAAAQNAASFGGGTGSWTYTALLAASIQPQSVVYAYTPPVGTTSSSGAGISLIRLSGVNRDLTAVVTSQTDFPNPDQAGAVVLATDANYPDALAGVPLAVARHAPLLLTTPTTLDPAVGTEIQRVLASGGTVYILGGFGAVAPTVTAQVGALGYNVVREAGATRFGTAIAVAGAMGNPSTVFEATGTDFPDALSAGAAAAKAGGVVLLTNGSSLPSDTAAYLSANPGSDYAIGGPAAAADSGATAIVGANRFATSLDVAEQLFPSPGVVGFASGLTFPDALSGGAAIGSLGGPMILVPATGALPSSLVSYLLGSGITSGILYGGTAAVGSTVVSLLGSL